MTAIDEKSLDDFETKLAEAIQSHRRNVAVIMAGLADRPSKGAKAAAREALTDHMRVMHELAQARSRLSPVPILGS